MNEELEGLRSRWPLVDRISLPEESTVVVVGSYKGITAQLLDEMFSPKRMFLYEPQTWAYNESIMRTFKADVSHLNYGLGVKTGLYPMGEWHTDGCSFVNVGPGSREQGEGKLQDANQALLKTGVDRFDFMLINIEGYEFYLLPYLAVRGWLKKVDRIAVQWHIGLGKEPKSYDDIAEGIDLLGREGLLLTVDERPSWTYSVRGN